MSGRSEEACAEEAGNVYCGGRRGETRNRAPEGVFRGGPVITFYFELVFRVAYEEAGREETYWGANGGGS